MRPRPPRTPEPDEIAILDIQIEEKATPNGAALKVLLLEDRDDFREILRDYLVSCGYQVISVRSGVEGLREIMKAPVDLVICDMMMPRMGGEMFYWAVTRVRPAAAQRFLFFTGHKNNPPIEFFFRRVNATVLFKPFKMSALDLAIRDVFSKVS
jgi:response regulator RpfG family c-di-GMP phosphodiesterase